MFNLTIKEAELVRNICQQDVGSVSQGDAVKVASILPKWMVKSAANPVKPPQINPSKIKAGLDNVITNLSNKVSPKVKKKTGDELKKLMSSNYNEALADKNISFWDKIKKFISGSDLTPNQQRSLQKANNLEMSYSDYLAAKKKLSDYEAIRNWSGRLNEKDMADYLNLAQQLGIYKNIAPNSSGLISRDDFASLQKSTRAIDTMNTGIQTLSNNNNTLVKDFKDLQKKHKVLENKYNKLDQQKVKEVANATQQGINNLNAAMQQRDQADIQKKLQELQARKWYQDPGAGAALGVGGTLAGIAGLNTLNNIFGGRSYDDRRRGSVVLV